MKDRQIWLNLLLTIFVIIIVLIIIEVALSVLDIPKYSTFPEAYRQADPILHHTFIPNSYGRMSNQDYTIDYFINSIGLRDDEIGAKKSYRILMVGDSFTEGMGVNANYTIAQQLENLFTSKGYDVEVINGGIASYSPILEYLYLKNKGLQLKPDLVILNLDLSDTIDDMNYEKLAKFKDGEVVAVPGDEVQPTSSLKGEIEMFCMKYKLNTCILAGRATLKLAGYYNTPTKDFISHYTNSAGPVLMNRTFDYLSKIDSLCKENGAKFILVTYPHAPHVSDNEWLQGRQKMGEQGISTYTFEFYDRVKELSEENNIGYIDTYYAFNRTKKYPLYHNLDPHMTEKGYRVLAIGIFGKLIIDKEIMSNI